MAKWMLILLLLANAAYFAWTQRVGGVAENLEGVTITSESPDEGRQLVLLKELD